MDSSTYTAGNFLGGDDLTDKEKDGLDVTITDVTAEEMRQGADKLCLRFTDPARKPMLLNKTNSKRLQKMFGKETDDWLDKPITIWFDPEVEYMGDIVGGLRVRVKNAKKK